MNSAKRGGGSTPRPADRRVRRTRSLLHEAAFTLIRERDYSSISVSDILERANIGRSTFYTHYRDKDELFAAAIGDMLDSARSAARTGSTDPTELMIGFSLPILEHICRHRSTAGARMGTGGRAVLHAHVRRILAGWVAEEMRRQAAGRSRPTDRIPVELLSQYISSTFVLILDWWLDRKCVPPPVHTDALFRSLVLPALRKPPRPT
jgi:AcrR family transcriptional regulator